MSSNQFLNFCKIRVFNIEQLDSLISTKVLGSLPYYDYAIMAVWDDSEEIHTKYLSEIFLKYPSCVIGLREHYLCPIHI